MIAEFTGNARALLFGERSALNLVGHLTGVATLSKVVLRPVPTAATAMMITTAISAASRPYSIAVTPSSLLRNRRYH